MKDYYNILGVSSGASQEEIKTAYRNKAKELHPDVSDKKNAEKLIAQVNDAYAVLSDPATRKEYDSATAQGMDYEFLNTAAGQKARAQMRKYGPAFAKGKIAEEETPKDRIIYLFLIILFIGFCLWWMYRSWLSLIYGEYRGVSDLGGIIASTLVTLAGIFIFIQFFRKKNS